MGRAYGVELARGVLSWSTSAAAASPQMELRGAWNLSIWGTFTGLSLRVERSFDGGTTWLPLTNSGVIIAYSGAASEVGEAPEDGVLYRINVTAIASGTVNARLSQ
jgi:hypothetical protein